LRVLPAPPSPWRGAPLPVRVTPPLPLRRGRRCPCGALPRSCRPSSL